MYRGTVAFLQPSCEEPRLFIVIVTVPGTVDLTGCFWPDTPASLSNSHTGFVEALAVVSPETVSWSVDRAESEGRTRP